MLSLKAQFFKSMLRRQIKPEFQRLLDDQAGFAENVVKFRATVEKRSARFVTPRDLKITPWQGQPGASEIIEAPSSTPESTPESTPDWALLYLHGGGYFFGSPVTHRSISGFLARTLPAKTHVLDYRLAPEHPFPAALEDAVAAYQALLDQGYAPSQIVVSGDSAGGGLSLALCLRLRELGLPQPCALALMSPLVDLVNTRQSALQNTHKDDMFSHRIFGTLEKIYHGETAPDHPLVSPIHADLSGLPPMLVHVSTTEVLLDDSLRLAAKVRKSGGQAELQILEGLPHVWHVFCGLVPEADRDTRRLALFMRAQLQIAEMP